MTKQDAIAILKRIQEPEAWEPQINLAAFEALEMAIAALSDPVTSPLLTGKWKSQHMISEREKKE